MCEYVQDYIPRPGPGNATYELGRVAKKEALMQTTTTFPALHDNKRPAPKKGKGGKKGTGY